MVSAYVPRFFFDSHPINLQIAEFLGWLEAAKKNLLNVAT